MVRPKAGQSPHARIADMVNCKVSTNVPQCAQCVWSTGSQCRWYYYLFLIKTELCVASETCCLLVHYCFFLCVAWTANNNYYLSPVPGGFSSCREIQFKVISCRLVYILILKLVRRMVRLTKLNDGLHSHAAVLSQQHRFKYWAGCNQSWMLHL